MRQHNLILSIDQGSTGTTALVLDASLKTLGRGYKRVASVYPRASWVEHDPLELYRSCLDAANEAVLSSGAFEDDIACITLTNQRETLVCWDGVTRFPLYNAISWQCRRSEDICRQMRELGIEQIIRKKTGLIVDPYFSATKLAWLFQNVPDIRDAADSKRLKVGTVDSWLMNNLTGYHVTDMTNASRTMLFNIESLAWDQELQDIFGVHNASLPAVVASDSPDTHTIPERFLGLRIPVTCIVGDQQSSLVGLGCTDAGMAKVTYGTGGFLVLNIGPYKQQSPTGIIQTVGIASVSKIMYAFEGSMFVAGSLLEWLKRVGILPEIEKTNEICSEYKGDTEVYVIPALAGWGAPHWAPKAKALIAGATLATSSMDIVVASIESIAFQTKRVIDTIRSSTADADIHLLRVDGGLSRVDYLCQVLADLLSIPIQRFDHPDATAVGAAIIGGLKAGVLDSEAVNRALRFDRVFMPDSKTKDKLLTKFEQWEKYEKISLEMASA